MSLFNKLATSPLGVAFNFNFNLNTRIMKNLSGLVAVLATFLCTSILHGQDNLIVPDTWTAGTGNTSGYFFTGDSSENERIPGLDPLGLSSNSILWVAKPSGNSVHDGGFTAPVVSNIDTNKTYRFSVWIKKTGSTSGTSYFGLFTRSSSNIWTNNVVTQHTNGNVSTNPYFWSGDLPELNKWYLMVGYLRPNSYSGVSEGAMYDGVTKLKVTGVNLLDYKFGNGAVNMQLRALLFNDSNVGDFQYYWKPMIHEVNSQMPTIDDLLGVNDTTPVTGVSVSPTSSSIDIGATQQLTANIFPSDAADQTVSWSSSNDAIATVDTNGLVTPVNVGDATITVTTTDGGFSANANIEITSSNTGGDFGSYKLYNATSNAFLNNITDGATYYIDDIGSNEIAIEAVAPQSYLNATHGKKVRFNISPSSEADWLEGAHPYFMRGDNGNIYGGWTPPLDTPVTFTISYYDNSAGTGTPIGSDQFTLTFEQSAPNNPPTGNVNEISGAGVTNVFYNGQNIGIGTDPQSTYRLAVDGKIHTKEVKVDQNGWADYVFYNDYNLPTLEQVQKHIKEKGHLINIPSAEEVEANGIQLGEMNKLLLEKIEELTLYILQQEKRIKALEDK